MTSYRMHESTSIQDLRRRRRIHKEKVVGDKERETALNSLLYIVVSASFPMEFCSLQCTQCNNNSPKAKYIQ
jgi:hypothetical protein